jgi:hypothetical protein
MELNSPEKKTKKGPAKRRATMVHMDLPREQKEPKAQRQRKKSLGVLPMDRDGTNKYERYRE